MKRLILTACTALLATAAVAQDTSHLRPYNERADRQRPLVRNDARQPEVTPQALAPRLTSVAVFAVASTQPGAWEGTYGKSSTTGDHGGALLRVAVEEWGYSNSRVAKFNGAVLPSSANYQSEAICGGTPAAPVGCSPGQSVIGFMEYWNLYGLGDSGTFDYLATSANGGGTYSTSIYIR